MYIGAFVPGPDLNGLDSTLKGVIQFLQDERTRELHADVVIDIPVRGVLILPHWLTLTGLFAGLVEGGFEGGVQHVAFAVVAAHNGFDAAHFV